MSVKYNVTVTDILEQGISKTGSVTLSFNRGEYEVDLGIDFNALDFRHYDEVALSYASIDGFIAGCAKISADTYLEFTNLGGYKLVEAASTDYTLLI